MEQTAGEQKMKIKNQKKIMNETFGEHPLLDFDYVPRCSVAKIAGGSVEICTALKTNYMSWHLNVCKSFHFVDVYDDLLSWCMRKLPGGVLLNINNFVIQISPQNGALIIHAFGWNYISMLLILFLLYAAWENFTTKQSEISSLIVPHM